MNAEPPTPDGDALQRLLRLKRYEQPPPEFADEFLERFQRRQRSEIVRRSSLGLLWERVQARLDSVLRRPAFLLSAAAAYGAVMLALWLLPRPQPQGSLTVVVPGAPGATSMPVDYQAAPAHGNGNAQGQVIQHSTAPRQDESIPGKRRTPGQRQDKESIIGPESDAGAVPQVPLRDL